MITVTVIGFGNVGRVLTTLLLGSKHALQINILDPADSLTGAFLDLQHAMGMHTNKRVHFNDAPLMEQSDFIFFTAGIPSNHGASRLTTVADNTRLVKTIFAKRSLKPSTRIIAITNPVDVVTAALMHYSKLPWDQVVGTGTFLDSERFAYYLAENTLLEQTEIDALVIGEHGESFVPVLSRSTYKGKPIQEHESFTKEVIENAVYQTHHAAFEIRKTEPGTSMAVSHCALRIMEYWMQENKKLLPISVLVDNELSKRIGLKHPVVMSVPVWISSNGIERETPLQLSSVEWKQLKKSAETLQQYQGFLDSD